MFTLTLVSLMTLTIFCGIPYSYRISNMACLSTESNAFLKLINTNVISLFALCISLMISLRAKI